MSTFMASYVAPGQSAGGTQYFSPSMWGIGLKANTWPLRIIEVETNFTTQYLSFNGWNILGGASLSIASAISTSPATFVPLRLNSPPPTATGGACYWWENTSGTFTFRGSAPTGVTSQEFFVPPSIVPSAGSPWTPTLALTIPVGSALWMGSLNTYNSINNIKDYASASYCRIWYEELKMMLST